MIIVQKKIKEHRRDGLMKIESMVMLYSMIGYHRIINLMQIGNLEKVKQLKLLIILIILMMIKNMNNKK